MWHKFQENHPIAYEIVQWGILGLASAGLIMSAISTISQADMVDETIDKTNQDKIIRDWCDAVMLSR